MVFEFSIRPGTGMEIYGTGGLKFESRVNRDERITTGIRELDKVLGGGLIQGTITLVLGASGSGKTLLTLVMSARNVLQGRRVLYINLEEPRDQVEHTLREMGYDVTRLREAGLTIHTPNVSLWTPYMLASYIRSFRSAQRRPDLIIVDGALAMAQEYGVDEMIHIMRDIARQCKQEGISLVITLAHDALDPSLSMATIADTVIWLRLIEHYNKIRRLLLIPKARMLTLGRLNNIFELILNERGELTISKFGATS